MILLLLFIVGIFVGVISVLFGIGGGIIATPVLYSVFPNTPTLIITGTTLGLVFINTFFNCLRFIWHNPIKFNYQVIPYIFTVSLFAILGVKYGVDISSRFPKQVVIGLFLVAIIVTITFSAIIDILKYIKEKNKSILNISDKTIPLNNEQLFIHLKDIKKTKESINDYVCHCFFKDKKTDTSCNTKKLISITLLKHSFSAFLSFFGGALSGITGVGIGAIAIPLYLFVAKAPIKLVSFLANISLLIGTSIGVVMHLFAEQPNSFPIRQDLNYQTGNINFSIIIPIVLGTFLTAPLTIKFVNSLSNRIVKILYYVFLVLLCVKIALMI